MFDRLEELALRYKELEERVAEPSVASHPARLRETSREMAALRDTVEAYRRWTEIRTLLEQNAELLSDPDEEIRELARAEIAELKQRQEQLEAELRLLLLPRDPNDDKNIVLEIRGGTGGEEAALFAADLLRMYTRYSERTGWKLELLSLAETDGGGIKEAIASISGRGVYGRLKHESGVHRVQRVPETESQGRIHTSTVTVAVMPEAEEVDVKIDPQELRIDVMRAGGPGGQSVNTTDSAVRITHLPTGLVVQCQDEKSQHKNKARAMKVLRSRLLEAEQQKAEAERASERRSQVGTGERSEKIRTYNFPQTRVTDHRAGVTLHKLDAIIAGDLGELLDEVTRVMTARAKQDAAKAESE